MGDCFCGSAALLVLGSSPVRGSVTSQRRLPRRPLPTSLTTISDGERATPSRIGAETVEDPGLGDTESSSGVADCSTVLGGAASASMAKCATKMLLTTNHNRASALSLPSAARNERG